RPGRQSASGQVVASRPGRVSFRTSTMSSTPTCRRCGTPLRSRNRRAQPTLCAPCRRTSTAPVSTAGPRPAWLYGLRAAAAVLTVGLAVLALIGVAQRFKNRPLTSADDQAEQTAAAPQPGPESLPFPPAPAREPAADESLVRVAAQHHESGH